MSGLTGGVWMNWARQQRCAPARFEKVASEAELVSVVDRARREGLRVRAVGAGHSFTDICCTDGVIVDLSAMRRLVEFDGESGLVTVEAGITIHALAEQLAVYGLALENQGDIDAQTLGGAIATATHGTGRRFGNLSSRVVACRMVTGDGRVRVFDESTPEELKAARVSLGALGIISSVTLQTVPAFRISRLDRPRKVAEVLSELDEWVDGHDHFELLAMPHSGMCLTMTSERTSEEPQPRGRLKAFVDDEVVSNGALWAVNQAGKAIPRAVPRLARLMASAVSESRQRDESYRVYAHQRRVRFTEMEYAIPRPAAAEALDRVLELVSRLRIPVLFPIELRFVAADDAFLSTANGRETSYLAVHQVAGAEFETYFRAVEEVMNEYAGRPHWGKRHYQSATPLAKRYPDWARFRAVRDQLDPTGVFGNDYLTRILGR